MSKEQGFESIIDLIWTDEEDAHEIGVLGGTIGGTPGGGGDGGASGGGTPRPPEVPRRPNPCHACGCS